MFNKRESNAKIFKDTEILCNTFDILINTIDNSNKGQYIQYENDCVKVSEEKRYLEPAKVIVSRKRTLEAAGQYKDYKVCVHNFASATNPGGGVVNGANAQEEAICRCSTLYFNISQPTIKNGYHIMHRNMINNGVMDATYNDDCIYTPGVLVFKSDTDFPELMEKNNWYTVDVITCAAPNLRESPSNNMNPNSGNQAVRISDEELIELHIKRMSRVVQLAKAEGEEVLILGAFGCGAFWNSPSVVAEAMASVVNKYRYDFKIIEFAVYCSDRDTENYQVFNQRFSEI